MFSLLELSDEAVQFVTRWIIRKFFLIFSFWVLVLSSNKQTEWRGKKATYICWLLSQHQVLSCLFYLRQSSANPVRQALFSFYPWEKWGSTMVPVARLPFNTLSPATGAVAMDILDLGLTRRDPGSENFGIYCLWGDPPIDDTVRRSSLLSKAFVQRSKSFPRFH